METNKSQVIDKIMQAFDEGLPSSIISNRFPEYRATIEEISSMRVLLSSASESLVEPAKTPVTNGKLTRSTKRGDLIESPYNIINTLLTWSMNYKIIVPVLVLGVLAIGGFVLSGKNTYVANNSEGTPVTENGGSNSSGDTTVNLPGNASVNDVLAVFSADITSEQTATNASDGLSADSFAVAQLSDFNSDTYDF